MHLSLLLSFCCDVILIVPMFSYSSASISDNGICRNGSLLVRLEAKLSDLECRLRTIETKSLAAVSQALLVSAEPHSLAFSSRLATPEQLGNQGRWVTGS